MRIEYAPEVPAIRLYRYGAGELELLQRACADLAEGRTKVYALHDQQWVEPNNQCRFLLKANKRHRGPRRLEAGKPFVLGMPKASWAEVRDNLLPTAKGLAGCKMVVIKGEVDVVICVDYLGASFANWPL